MMAAGQVLLVDDDCALRDAVGRALRLEGFDVTLASDGPQALELAARKPPDIVVLDVAMPSMSGVEVCRRMRANGAQTSVLMLTAKDTIRDRVAGLDAGADDYLVKPFATVPSPCRAARTLEIELDNYEDRFPERTALVPLLRDAIIAAR